ncbi:hypothetical protein MLD38_007029 [Melastoma candidum]|uniref:Uncharacterized protein n=1 Tax=Melastoma candidum TaxID=119954 RepID=A0ACB9RRQ2_9MYRT|nr:hypothetical protein MLD38_007029 [Melastoma candidum]
MCRAAAAEAGKDGEPWGRSGDVSSSALIEHDVMVAASDELGEIVEAAEPKRDRIRVRLEYKSPMEYKWFDSCGDDDLFWMQMAVITRNHLLMMWGSQVCCGINNHEQYTCTHLSERIRLARCSLTYDGNLSPA